MMAVDGIDIARVDTGMVLHPTKFRTLQGGRRILSISRCPTINVTVSWFRGKASAIAAQQPKSKTL